MKNLKLKSIVRNSDELLRSSIKLGCTQNFKQLPTFLLIFIMTISSVSDVFSQNNNCDSPRNIKPIIKGIYNKGKETISLGNDATAAIIGCICRYRNTADGPCPGSITFDIQKPDGSIVKRTAVAKSVNLKEDDVGIPVFVYRLEYFGPLTKVTYNPPASRKSMRSLVVWKYSESVVPNVPNIYYIDKFFFNRHDDDTKSTNYKLKVPSSPGKNRNFTVEIPLADHSAGRKLRYRLRAYIGDQVIKTDSWKVITRDNDGATIRLDRLTFNNIDGRVTDIAVEVQSLADGNVVGDSVVIGSVLVSSTPCCTPTLNCPANIVRSSNVNSCSYTINGNELNPTVSGNCGAKLFNSYNGKTTLTGAKFPEGKTNITWSTWGGTITCQTAITVNTPTCPPSTCFSTFEYDTATCSCKETPIAVNCDDGIECTEDSINPETCECINEYIESETSCNLEDWFALKALYDSTDGDNWTRNDGWKEQFSNDCPPATCDLSNLYRVKLNEDGRVESINGYNNNLIGLLPPEIGDLTALKYLFLSSVDFLGKSIPKEIGNLTNLERLSIVASNLGGSIPAELGNLTNLWDLRLDYNVLEGNIPKELINNGSLTNLNLNNNQLSGCYFDELKVFCSQLTYFNFNGDADISANNNFDADWEDFCSNGSGTCRNFRLAEFTEFSMYPNPASSKVTIEFENEDASQQSLTIYDLAGEQYLSQSFEAGSNKKIELDVHDFPKGIYMVELNDGFQSSTQKLVIQ